uniref:Spaetzle domain-containing protein n=1 Tax=Strigamia maritima TaxID=126957 RepID=T1IL86_STRMM
MAQPSLLLQVFVIWCLAVTRINGQLQQERFPTLFAGQFQTPRFVQRGSQMVTGFVGPINQNQLIGAQSQVQKIVVPMRIVNGQQQMEIDLNRLPKNIQAQILRQQQQRQQQLMLAQIQQQKLRQEQQRLQMQQQIANHQPVVPTATVVDAMPTISATGNQIVSSNQFNNNNVKVNPQQFQRTQNQQQFQGQQQQFRGVQNQQFQIPQNQQFQEQQNQQFQRQQNQQFKEQQNQQFQGQQNQQFQGQQNQQFQGQQNQQFQGQQNQQFQGQQNQQFQGNKINSFKNNKINSFKNNKINSFKDNKINSSEDKINKPKNKINRSKNKINRSKNKINNFANNRINNFKDHKINSFENNKINNFKDHKINNFKDRKINNFKDLKINNFKDHKQQFQRPQNQQFQGQQNQQFQGPQKQQAFQRPQNQEEIQKSQNQQDFQQLPNNFLRQQSQQDINVLQQQQFGNNLKQNNGFSENEVFKQQQLNFLPFNGQDSNNEARFNQFNEFIQQAQPENNMQRPNIEFGGFIPLTTSNPSISMSSINDISNEISSPSFIIAVTPSSTDLPVTKSTIQEIAHSSKQVAFTSESKPDFTVGLNNIDTIVTSTPMPTVSTSSSPFKTSIFTKNIPFMTSQKPRRVKVGCEGGLGFCDVNDNYPNNRVAFLTSKCRDLISKMFVPLPDTFEETSNVSASVRQDEACSSEKRFLKPGFAVDDHGKWQVIIQTPEISQRVIIEMCRTPQHSCSGLTNTNTRSRCVQKFSFQLLMALDPERPDDCPAMRAVRVPTSCSCQIEAPRISI